ncbi:MAG: FAD-dependent oxidoreductase [Sphingobacteriaceae bacterium]|nr:FAD-dependent oxidoreductase [Sphingobacteriaceae bacterium]MBK7816535.1 FAD-dependent oxidoreductase [Sphingobacteriaceae bacterium]
MKEVDYLIIGAGVSGLSFANKVKTKNYLIVEKDPEAGGYCKTIKKQGFVWDYSGHFFHFQNNKIKTFLLKRMDKSAVVNVLKNSVIHYKHNYIDFPFQKNIHQLPKSEYQDCLNDLYKIKKTKPRSFKEMVYNNYGRSISEKFLIPYNEKLYACDLDTLDQNAMGRFFPQASLKEILKHSANPNNTSYNTTFTYPKNGAMQYIHALLKDLKSERILLNESVIKIDPKTKTAYTNKRTIKYKRLISSVPFPKLLSFTSMPFTKKDFSSNKVLVFNLGFDSKGNSEHHWVYFPNKKYRFYRIGYYDNIIQKNRMSLYVEIGMRTNEKVNVDKELSRVLNDLKKASIITDQKLIASHHVVMDPAYVHINKASQKIFLTKQKTLHKLGIYSIGRYGGWKYCSIEDNIIEAFDLSKKLIRATI